MRREQLARQTGVEVCELAVVVNEPETLDERRLVAEVVALALAPQTRLVAFDELLVCRRDGNDVPTTLEQRAIAQGAGVTAGKKVDCVEGFAR